MSFENTIYLISILYTIGFMLTGLFFASIVLKIKNHRKADKSKKMARVTTILIIVTAIPTGITIYATYILGIIIYALL